MVLPGPNVDLLAKVLEHLLDRVVVVVMVMMMVVLAMLSVTLLVRRMLLLRFFYAEALGKGRVVKAMALKGSVARAAIRAVHRLAGGIPSKAVVVQRIVGGGHAVKDRDGCWPLRLSAGACVCEILMVRLALVDIVEIVGKISAASHWGCGWRGSKIWTRTSTHALQDGIVIWIRPFLEKGEFLRPK